MCYSIAEGGKRCHTQKLLERQRNALRFATVELKELEHKQSEAGGTGGYRLNRRVEDKQRKVASLEAKLDATSARLEREHELAEQKKNQPKVYAPRKPRVPYAKLSDEEKAERDARAAKRAERKEANSTRTELFLGANFYDDEWAELDERVRRLGYKYRSDYIRHVLATKTPEFSARPPQHERNEETRGKMGRHPTRVGQDRYRNRRSFRANREVEQKLKAEAKLFGLSYSDYMRCLLFDIDPRGAWDHNSEKTYQRRRASLENASAINLLDGTSEPRIVKSFWDLKILEIRRGSAEVERRKAASEARLAKRRAEDATMRERVGATRRAWGLSAEGLSA